MTRDRPDQLDSQIAQAINKFRRMANQARVNLNMASACREYPIETAVSVYESEMEGELCEHGLSASNCYGPQHYYYDVEEQARGLLNEWGNG